MRRSTAFLILASATLVTCTRNSNAPVGVRPLPAGSEPAARAPTPQPAGVLAIQDEQGRSFQIAQGEPGPPGLVGCADGQREAFIDAAAFPTIAGCIAEWDGRVGLRAARTQGGGCGDDLGPCGAPEDACAAGWHLCGDTGAVADLLRVTPEQCAQAGGGRFVAALSHCKTQSGCNYEPAQTANYACFDSGWCSEPVCCGNDCGQFGVCRDGVWKGATHIPVGTDQGCGAIGSSRARGVLCCKG
jgi:hypothetical protein